MPDPLAFITTHAYVINTLPGAMSSIVKLNR